MIAARAGVGGTLCDTGVFGNFSHCLGFLVLFDFAVHSHFAHHGVVLLQLEAVGRVFAVFLRHVAANSGESACFVLGALEDDLEAVAFALFGHGRGRLSGGT